MTSYRMTMIMNQSSVDSIVFEEELKGKMTNDVYDNIPTKVITVLTCISVLTIGNVLWFGIIHFELYGGDPKKRSITNKVKDKFSLIKKDYSLFHTVTMRVTSFFKVDLFGIHCHHDGFKCWSDHVCSKSFWWMLSFTFWTILYFH